MTTERELREQEEKNIEKFLKEEYEPRTVKQNLITLGIIAAIVVVAYLVLG